MTRRPRLFATLLLTSSTLCAGALARAAQVAGADAAVNTSGGALMDEQASFDVQHYALEMEVMPASKEIDAVLTMTARTTSAAREIALHLDSALRVQMVKIGLVGGGELKKVDFTHADGLIFVPTESLLTAAGLEFQVSVAYRGTPHVAVRPPWDGGFTWSEHDGQPWIATSCQGEGADLWWPCKDHPSDKPESFDLAFTVPEGLTVATNGQHVSTDVEGGKTTSRWKVTTPIANYSIALNVGPYVELTRSMKSVAGDEIPIHFWVLTGHEKKGEALLDEIVDHLSFFEDTCGPYPFRGDKYGVVETPHLGMEHQTIIAYGNQFNGDRNFDYDWLHHHELAHEWWANLVTAVDWADFWIHEGIGSYMQPLYLERKFGAEAYAKKMRVDLLRVLNQAPVAPRPPRTTDSMYFAKTGTDAPGIDIYFKGSWMCHSLRWVLGDETFFRVLRRWAYPDPALEKSTDGSATRFETTEGMIAIAEKVAERELDWFFDVYLRKGPLPEVTHKVENGLLTIEWSAPGGLVFPMPVEVSINGTLQRIELPDGKITFEVGEGAEIEVDPNKRVLRVL